MKKIINRIIGFLLYWLIMYLIFSFIEYDLTWLFDLEKPYNRFMILFCTIGGLFINIVGKPLNFIK